MMQCICGSYAINHHLHGRLAGKYEDLCDVCYWRTSHDALQSLNAELLEALDNVVHAEMNSPIHENNSGCIKRMQGIARSAIAKARSQA
jgi:hypothetical protein